MDMSLDQIIAGKPKTGRGGRGGLRGARRGSAREQVLGKAPASPTSRARASATPSTAPTTTAQKIIVSNLPNDVNEAQISELFAQTVGPVKNVTLTYDSNGKSKGLATVIFQKASDGAKAFQQYNNRLIDGKRAMKIEMVVDPNRAQQHAPLASRVAAQPSTDATTGRTRGTATRGRGRGRGGRSDNNTKRAPKTAADLDAEMEDYTSNNTAAEAPAPAAAAA